MPKIKPIEIDRDIANRHYTKKVIRSDKIPEVSEGGFKERMKIIKSPKDSANHWNNLE